MPPPPVPYRATSQVKRAQTPSGVEEASIAVFAQKRELDELRIKVRLLEGRRMEDQEKIKVMEAKAAEADTLRAARVKLQGTYMDSRIRKVLTSSQISRITNFSSGRPTICKRPSI
jgi:dynactin 1